MNILYLAHRIPYPPNKGDKLRAFRFLEHLTKNHDVWCACFVDTDEDMEHVPVLRGICCDVATVRLHRGRALLGGAMGWLRGRTVTESFYRNGEMRRHLTEWTESVTFDVAVAFSSSMAPYALGVPARRRVLDLCDLDSAKWAAYADFATTPLQWLYRTEGRRLARREQEWVRSFDASIVVTEAEASDLRTLAPDSSVQVVTNGVEIPRCDAAPPKSPCATVRRDEPQASARAMPRGATQLQIRAQSHSAVYRGSRASREPSRADHDTVQRPTGSTVGIVGLMDFFPNVDGVCWFVDKCWAAIREAVPDATFRIVGRRPVRRVCALSRVPGIEVVGEVDNVAAELARFDVSVAPLRIAGGLQNKVLEAMAYGLPVVLTEQAARGINAGPDRDYVVASSPDRMIRQTVRLLCDPDCRVRIAASARRYVERHHRWADALRHFDLLATGAIERSADREPVEPTRRAAPRSTALPVS